ncbi:putative metallophosphoesterase YhaO [Pseudoprimorskyibacter insulae]|uniref:Putative metallophosphoesterase YhaO n=2 Tax=Pseudoprimorskyibacter insulae TaxID=1695997 RepID=A0A2R8APU9_9RHOB|nr:putative metallophosphoesterase YhaO [Pseudoprimorskyibacter insulae]
MRILHAADLHLDSPLRSVALRDPVLGERLRNASRDVLRKIVDLAIEHQVDALVLAGDVFDNGVPDVSARTVLSVALSRLGSAGIPTILIRGNHDGLLDHARYGPLGENVMLLDHDRPTVDISGVSFHGLSHGGQPETRSFLPRYPAPVPGRINVGVMHCSPDGTSGHDPYAPCSVSEMLGHGYDYWALGHIHKRQEWRGDSVLAVMAGIPQGRHIREVDGGSVTLVEIDGLGARAEAIPVSLIAFREVELPMPAEEAQDARTDRLRAALAVARAGDVPTVLRVALSGPGAQLFSARSGEAASYLEVLVEDIEGLHLDRVLVRAGQAPDVPALVGDLAAAMREEAKSPGFRDEAERMLTDLRDVLPSELREVLDPAELDDLIEEGLAAVAARLALAERT